MMVLNVDSLVKIIGESSCDCDKCKEMCKRRTCWALPSEIDKIIDAGFADKLMLDYWSGDPDFDLVCPSIKGSEMQRTPWMPTGECCLQKKDGHCELHAGGLKPVEARLSHCNDDEKIGDVFNKLHAAIAKEWDCDEGRKVIDRWKKIVNYDKRREYGVF